MDNQAYGHKGENTAAKYLLQKGYSILARNYRIKGGEIDIIAKTGNTVVFVEVKYRSTFKYGYPAEAVNIYKRLHLSRAAASYIKENQLFDVPMRFDVVQVTGDYVNHITNAFESAIRF